jgi:hypothetical protein
MPPRAMGATRLALEVLGLPAHNLRRQLVLRLGHVWLSAAVLPRRPIHELLRPKRRHIS